MKIAITGGAGFIGSILTRRLLDAGHRVLILDLKPSSVFPKNSRIVDVCDAEAIKARLKGAEVVYHLAGVHGNDISPVSKFYDVNVGGAQNVAAAADALGIGTVVYVSASDVYSLESLDTDKGASERVAAAPHNNYGQSKFEAERVFLKWANIDKERRRLVAVRLAPTFGGGGHGNIQTLMRRIATRKFIMVGDGTNVQSVAYVENVAEFLGCVLNLHVGSHLYNYADQPDLPMKDLVGHIRVALGRTFEVAHVSQGVGALGGAMIGGISKITGKKPAVNEAAVVNFCRTKRVNAAKAHESGFVAPVALVDGLKAAIDAEFSEYKNA